MWIIAMVSAGLLISAGCTNKEGDRDTAPAAAPDPAEPAAPEPTKEQGAPEPAKAPTTPEECTAAGGTFVASTGGEPACPEGKRALGPIRFGIEGGTCCK